MKRILLTLMILAIASFAFAGGDGEAEGYEDGVYFAQENGFNEQTGWKYMVTIEVEDGVIVDAEWNGANVNAGPDKITLSESGGYPMVAAGGAQSDWHVQAALVEEYLLEVQDPAKMEYDSGDGTTDAISGVSIHINEFVTLAEEALEQGPVGLGPYKDGAYSAEAADFDHNWKDRVDLTVISGRIVAAYWNPVNEEGQTKNEASEAGEYGMVANGGAQAPWFEQADAAEAALLETQDPSAIPVDDEGSTDAISGVSITVSVFLELAAEALEGAM
jgi:major membrane immunogen (membrane-anchored lipoprotein)